MVLCGQLAELMETVNPELYRPYVTMENSKPVLYMEVLKAIYGCLRLALLFYLKLRKDLESSGFEVNPYNLCVANKIVKGTQFTICLHIDNLKASHKRKDVIDNFIKWLGKKYENKDIGELKAHCRKAHTYLGIILDYTTKKK